MSPTFINKIPQMMKNLMTPMNVFLNVCVIREFNQMMNYRIPRTRMILPVVITIPIRGQGCRWEGLVEGLEGLEGWEVGWGWEEESEGMV